MSVAISEHVKSVLEHLQSLIDQPDKPIIQNVLDQIGSVESERLDSGQRRALLGLASKALFNVTQDPGPLINLIRIVTTPEDFTFQHVRATLAPEHLQAALAASNYDINRVALHLLTKATKELADINWLASYRTIVEPLVVLWLSSEDTGVASLAEDVLVSLLQAGVEDGTTVYDVKVDPATSSNLMYRRLFLDQDIYLQFFSHCGIAQNREQAFSRKKMSIAQGRLLSFLLRIRNSSVRTSQNFGIESKYGATEALGLAGFAVNNMIDMNDDDDPLIARTFIDFCRDYIKDAPMDDTGEDSWERRNLSNNNTLHTCMRYYLIPEDVPNDIAGLKSASAEFISEYCVTYRHLIRKDRRLLMDLKSLVEAGFGKINNRQWISNNFYQHDLHVLSSLPQEIFASSTSIVNDIPLVTANATPIDLLTPLFTTSHIRDPANLDRQATRLNYFYYIRKHKHFWRDIAVAARNLVNLDVAKAANNLLDQIIHVDWSLLSSDKFDSSLPTEEQLGSEFGAQLPITGIEALLMDSNYQSIIEYLLSDGRSIMPSSSVYDEDSPGWLLAKIKWEILKSFQERMLLIEVEGRELLDGQDRLEWGESMHAIQEAVNRRVRAGPLGSLGPGSVGEEVAAIGM